MSDYLSLSDLFVVGVGFDLAGAWLVAKGLLVKESVLAQRAGQFWGGNPGITVGAVEDRVDAKFGVGFLLFGFSLQALGYVVGLGVDLAAEESWMRAVIAAGLLFLFVGLALAVRGLARERFIRKALIEVAHWKVVHATKEPERMGRPFIKRLVSLGEAWSRDRSSTETDEKFVARVFGVRETTPGDSSDD